MKWKNPPTARLVSAFFSNRQCTPIEWPLSHVLQVDKSEWETFLSEFSALTKNYELILNKLELAHTQMKELYQRNEALTRELQRALSDHHGITESKDKPEEPPKPKESKLIEPASTPAKRSFLQAFRDRLSLEKRKPQTLSRGYVACQRCGFPVRRASRICEGCGTDFGSIICPCGRALTTRDKFCDRCGRTTGVSQ